MAELERLALHDLHLELGARMVPFAGHEMPVQYAAGVMKEHLHVRAAAGLFDVSHMGQVRLLGAGAAEALERLVPADILGLREGRQRYGLFTAASGGILDDLMIARRPEDLFLVVNAARKEHDVAHLRAAMSGHVRVEVVTDRALLALQGPAAETALARLVPAVTSLRFMDVTQTGWEGVELWISRSGYTGEDGFEISVPEAVAERLARTLLSMDEVAPIGLGARDSLRLEAGMPLYGHDITEETSPVEADLAWSIQKVRRKGGAREGGFPGAERILRELEEGPKRRRTGILPEGRAPMREGTPLFAAAEDETPVGTITSGGFAPSLGRPVAMGYVPTPMAAPDTPVYGEVRGKRLPARTAQLPFHKPNYKR
ncbi:MAG: glycine cleavage system aminomethyltransferase GcvT [Alphaproteobacteria bacterium]|nr:MAG: glycine cleavage system aminomethyltransferase GcvT [Alphaproteobacteria bacterium]